MKWRGRGKEAKRNGWMKNRERERKRKGEKSGNERNRQANKFRNGRRRREKREKKEKERLNLFARSTVIDRPTAMSAVKNTCLRTAVPSKCAEPKISSD